MMLKDYNFKDYLYNILSASAIGIVICVIPTAILYELFNALEESVPRFHTLKTMMYIMQFLTPAVIGLFVGITFKMDAMRTSLIAITAFLASRPEIVMSPHGYELVGMGNILNAVLICFISVVLIKYIGNKFSSFTILVLPVIICGGVGLLGLYTYHITNEMIHQLGLFIGSFTSTDSTTLSIMTYILISVVFSIIIILPISTIGIAAIITIGGVAGLNGLYAGASALGITACTAVMTVGSFRVNKSGFTVCLVVGTVKLMMPNLFKYPVMAIPVIINAIIVGIFGYLLGIEGNTTSSGYGLIGMIGPVTAFGISHRILPVILAYFIIPFTSAYLIDLLCQKLFKLYRSNIFKFVGFPSTEGIEQVKPTV